VKPRAARFGSGSPGWSSMRLPISAYRLLPQRNERRCLKVARGVVWQWHSSICLIAAVRADRVLLAVTLHLGVLTSQWPQSWPYSHHCAAQGHSLGTYCHDTL
jgi:hypothetical protein